MNILKEIRHRFRPALGAVTENTKEMLEMIRPAQNPQFGDYQANFPMPLSKKLGKPAPEVAAQLLEQVQMDDVCQQAEVAGPGFINLTLNDEWLGTLLSQAFKDQRLGVSTTDAAKKYIVDFSSPNVAKPMHVGHIRSTVIGDALSRVLRFLGHEVVTDNHLGDWGTQFGMIIYGYKHFVAKAAYEAQPVTELSRLYRLVRQLMDYHAALSKFGEAQALAERQKQVLVELEASEPGDDKKQAKKRKVDLKSITSKIANQAGKIEGMEKSIAAVDSDPDLSSIAANHSGIGVAVLHETALLHEGDETNTNLWNEFLPHCHEDIQRVYDRMGVEFDRTHGESFYHQHLAAVVQELEDKGVATQSEGATCVFLDNHDTPMVVRKSDGAFLYSTTDLATIRYRMAEWNPDVILYVVDFRQHEHFAKVFDVARQWGYPNVEYNHVEFGTVMGEDGKPFKTRSGDTVGLESLLDDSEVAALKVVSEMDDAKPTGPEFDDVQRRGIAQVVGIGALKYADLSTSRTSNYTFSHQKMLQLSGNTATYLQYGYARVQGIFRRGEVAPESLMNDPVAFQLQEPIERQLAIKLLRFEEALDDVCVDFRPHLLASYLFELTQTFFVFFDKCHVLKSEGELRQSRLQLCDLTGRIISQGLALLGIKVVPKM